MGRCGSWRAGRKGWRRSADLPGLDGASTTAYRLHVTKLRAHRIALVLSLGLNVVLIAAFWLYLHFEATLDIVETAVGFLN